MGIFYTSLTLKTDDREGVVAYLSKHRRDAFDRRTPRPPLVRCRGRLRRITSDWLPKGLVRNKLTKTPP